MRLWCFAPLAVLMLTVAFGAETRASVEQIASVTRAGNGTVYEFIGRSNAGSETLHRVLAMKPGPPCEEFFGGDQVTADYDGQFVTLTKGARTCYLGIIKITIGAEANAPDSPRGRQRRQAP